MDKKYIYYLVITVIGVFFVLYFYNTQINKPKFGLEVDPTKDTTDISGIQYRIRITNVGKKQLTGIVVDLGKNEFSIYHFLTLDSHTIFIKKLIPLSVM